MLNIQSLIKYPIPRDTKYNIQLKEYVLEQIKHYSHDIQDKIDNLIYEIYGLDKIEIKEIESY